MDYSVFAIHAAVLVVAIVIAYLFYIRTLRLQAKYRLYKVRDDFVYLVASDQLEEESRVFKHYYCRINALLQAAPSIGLDDILQRVFHEFKTSDQFERMLEQAKRQAEQLFKDPAFQNPSIREAVAEYYQAVRLLILSHSSYVRLAYVVTRCVLHVEVPITPVKHGLEAVDYAEREARLAVA